MIKKRTDKPWGTCIWLGIATIILLLDQLSKVLVTKMLGYGEVVPVTHFFNLILTYNTGAAFSFLAHASGWQRYFFTIIGVAAAFYMIFLIKRYTEQKLFCLALSFILGGAIGNVIDRVMYGHVIDFLDFYYKNSHFPTFNLADSAISLGAILFIIDELRRVKGQYKK